MAVIFLCIHFLRRPQKFRFIKHRPTILSTKSGYRIRSEENSQKGWSKTENLFIFLFFSAQDNKTKTFLKNADIHETANHLSLAE